MSRIFLDAGLAQGLHNAGGPVELCDPSGHVFGSFVPLVSVSDCEPVSPEVSEAELDRRSQAGRKRYTTAQVMNHLFSL